VNTVVGTLALVLAGIFLIAGGFLALTATATATEPCGCDEPPAPCSCQPPTPPSPNPSAPGAALLSRVASDY
jgi:hypothetical protein